MVNIDDFIKRLEKLLDHYSLTASSFADKIGVQRSSMSHLLSGRNKPSLDFILKIMEVFPEVDLYWILNGKGSFPMIQAEEKQKEAVVKEDYTSEDLFKSSDKEGREIGSKQAKITTARITSSNIEKIVIFYVDGTFKEYNPE